MPIWRGFRLAGGPALLMALAGFGSDHAHGAGAAYQVDTADVSEPGNCKVESWASFAKNGDFIGSTSPDCVVSVFGKPVDFSAQFSRFKSDDEWGSAAFPKAKTNLIPTAVGQMGFAVSGSMAVDLITGNVAAWFVTVPMTYRFSETVRMNINVGYARDRNVQKDYFT